LFILRRVMCWLLTVLKATKAIGRELEIWSLMNLMKTDIINQLTLFVKINKNSHSESYNQQTYHVE